MDRAEVRQSAAFQAMTLAGRRVLYFIEGEIERNGDSVAIPLTTFTSRGGMCRTAARFGIKQCERLGFISVGTGVRHANTFRLISDWKSIGAVEAARQVQLAKLPKPPKLPQVAAPKPVQSVKPAPTPKPVTVAAEQPRTVQQRGVTLPRLAFMDDGR